MLLGLNACNEKAVRKPDVTENGTSASSTDSEKSGMLRVEDKIFNIPSPLETALLLQNIDQKFNPILIGEVLNVNKYATKKSQALNLGVYGADLGYALIYQENNSALSLFKTCKTLGTQIGISPALYVDVINRFGNNTNNPDSLVRLVSELNRTSEAYLQNSESRNLSTLILFGGWIESLYFSTKLAESNKNSKLISRIGEQKQGLDDLIELLSEYNEQDDLASFIKEMQDLKSSYDKIEYSYEWVMPETDENKRLTTIRSKSTTMIPDQVLTEISNKVFKIRMHIIDTTSL